MINHAKAHMERCLAALAAQQGVANARHHATGYELMLAKLDEDRRRLHQIQSTQRKIAVKRELLPEYAAWVEGVLAGKSGVQDDVFMMVMLWQIDVADFASALTLARYALAHKLVMPERFKRSTACLIAEEMAETTLRASTVDQAKYAECLADCMALTASEDMPDEVRATLHKAAAYAMLAQKKVTPDRLRQCLAWLQRALQLYERVGVKKDIERIERELKNLDASG
ncbi:phage terminase small subunit [Uliginosibacterium gangwonense]|uniref:phage terminase small subunit n=1 Tax=Uliginosibacterium gangwonense TaxID=392736 RepID=UPI000377A414|nr:phage terminase small subunit [Uliginosibacterium gangwonense]